MSGITQKNLWSFISIEVSYCPLGNCLRHFYQGNLVIGPYENKWERAFFLGQTTHYTFCWSNLTITGNFSNSAAQFLLVEACDCVNSIFCFLVVLSVLKVFTLKVFKCPNIFFFLSDKCIFYFLLFLFRSKSNNLAT